MKYAGLVLILAVTTMGCTSRANLTKALAESKAAEAQKDSLLTEVLETTQFVSDLNSELAKAKVAALEIGEDRGVPGAQQDKAERQATLGKIRQVIDRLNESEAGQKRQDPECKAARADRDLQADHRRSEDSGGTAAGRDRGDHRRSTESDRDTRWPGRYAQLGEGLADRHRRASHRI